MLLLTLNFKKRGCLFHCWKGQPLALMVSLLLLRLGLCTLGHPSHAGHRVRSSARLTLSISLFGPVRPCVPLKTTSSIGPIFVGLALPKRKAGPFFAERCRHPGGGFCAVLRGFGAYFSSPWAYPQQTAFRIFRSPGLIEEDHSKSGFLSGLLLQFINPKIYIYCIMSMEAYILPYYSGQPLTLLLFDLLLSLIGFVFTIAWTVFGSVFQTLFSRHARVVNTILALLLVYCAVSLFLA